MSCPFYGKHATALGLVASGGNQCALILDALAPCVMEAELRVAADAWACPLLAAVTVEYIQRRPSVRALRQAVSAANPDEGKLTYDGDRLIGGGEKPPGAAS